MDILITVIGAVLALVVLVFVLHPLWRAEELLADAEDEEDVTLEELYARRDSLYQAIKELEFDHQVGRVTEEDYRHFLARLKGEAADVLRQIDEVQSQQHTIVQYLEARVAELRQQQLHIPVATRADGEDTAGARYCTQCGTPARVGDRFCSQCGTPLQLAGETLVEK